VANRLQINHGSAYEIIHNRYGFLKVCARCVSKQLTMLHKETHLYICQHTLDRHDNKHDAFLDRIFTDGKTGIDRCELENEQQSMAFKHPQSSNKKRSKANHLQGNRCWTHKVQF
jgi:hypothetical protein